MERPISRLYSDLRKRSYAIIGEPYASLPLFSLASSLPGDLATIARLLAPDVSYHDMIYEDPFVGRDEVIKYLQKVGTCMPLLHCLRSTVTER